MKYLTSLCLLSLIASSMIAQVSPTISGGSITGHVIDAATGQPIKLALLQLRPETESARPSQSKTDENGKFAFENIVPGRYRLSASRNGYLRKEYGAKLPNLPGTLLEIPVLDHESWKRNAHRHRYSEARQTKSRIILHGTVMSLSSRVAILGRGFRFQT